MCPETITPNECVGLLLFDTWKNNPRTRLLTRCTRKRLQEELFALGWQKRRNQIREGRITPEIGEDTIVAAATEEVDIEETTIIEEAGIGETTIIEEEEEEETGIMIEGTTVATTDEMEDILAEEGEITMTAEAGMGAVAGMKTDELERVTTIDELEQVMTIEEDTMIKEATMIKDAMMIEEATTIEEVPTKIEGEEKAGTDTKTEELLSKKKERTRYPT